MTEIRVTHIGGPTVLVEFEGWRLLSDPTFDAPGRTYHFGWGTSSRKVRGPAIAADAIGPVDAVLLTHDHHADNLDDAGRSFIADVPVVVTTASGAHRLGGATRGLPTSSVSPCNGKASSTARSGSRATPSSTTASVPSPTASTSAPRCCTSARRASP
jgi:hypothetical protein